MSSSSEPKQRIQLLPEHIIDQIKAGEVIERPSTLLKELLENSIDAGADEVEIEIAQNGLDLLSVRDNGKGIPFEELDLAFCRHATSKIERFEDIYNLFTYGFRGEALASIAAVSKLTCVSNPKGEPEGLIKINGGETITLDKDKTPETSSGTKMYIRDLFYNTPARMKFIQSKTSEKNQLDKIIKAFLLTQPEVKFTVKWDEQDKKVFSPHPEENLKARVEDTIKKNRPLNLVEINSGYDGASFKVFLSRESTRGNAGKAQFIFVNGRLVQDVQIHKVILNAAQSLWPIGESGQYCAYIDVPAERVDVNIHPNKIQVKFYEAGKIFSLVSGAIKDGLARMRQSASNEFEPRESQPKNLEMQGISSGSSMKEVGYRQFDFDSSSSSSLNSYFERLDSTGPQRAMPQDDPSTCKTLAHFGASALYSLEGKVYGVKTPELMSLWLAQTLASGDKTPTPLLVSQPLELERPISSSQLTQLGDLGFEIDQIGAGDFVLRTFPTCLKNFPFRDYLQSYLNEPGKKRLEDCVLTEQSNWSHHHKKALETLGFALAIEKGCAIEVTKDKLDRIL